MNLDEKPDKAAVKKKPNVSLGCGQERAPAGVALAKQQLCAARRVLVSSSRAGFSKEEKVAVVPFVATRQNLMRSSWSVLLHLVLQECTLW